VKSLSLCSLIFFAIVSTGQSTARLNRTDEIESYHLVLPATEFDSAKIENRFRELLERKKPSTRLLKVQAMDREKSAELDAIGFTDITYGLWRLLFSDYETEIPPFAELIAFDGGAGMRFRDASGRIVVKVLGGRNPYEMQECGTTLSLLHVGISKSIKSRQRAESTNGVHFFYLSGEPVTETVAKCALRSVQGLQFSADVAVSVRKDPWFIQHSDFPVVSPFLSNQNPPTKQQYEEGPEWRCSLLGQRRLCSGWDHITKE